MENVGAHWEQGWRSGESARLPHQCGSGSIPGPGVIRGLSLLSGSRFLHWGFFSGFPLFTKTNTFKKIPIRSGIRGPHSCKTVVCIPCYYDYQLSKAWRKFGDKVLTLKLRCYHGQLARFAMVTCRTQPFHDLEGFFGICRVCYPWILSRLLVATTSSLNFPRALLNWKS